MSKEKEVIEGKMSFLLRLRKVLAVGKGRRQGKGVVIVEGVGLGQGVIGSSWPM